MLAAGVLLNGCISVWTSKEDQSKQSGKCTALQEKNPKKAPPSEEDKEKKEEDVAVKRGELIHKLEIAEASLDQMEMEHESRERDVKETAENAEKELELAAEKLARFKEFDAPNRIARAELTLKNMRDAAEEAKEELKQLELMYEEQDLEDKTREFVINRGKRNLERRKQSLAIEERGLVSLKEHEIPSELASIELDTAKKEYALGKARLGIKIEGLKMKVEMMKIRGEIEKVKEELAGLDDKEPSKCTGTR